MQQDILPQDSQVVYPKDYDPSLNGLDGWLVLVVLGRFLTIIIGIFSIVRYAGYLGIIKTLDIILWPVILVEGIVYILGSGIILYMMFSRRILFRKLFVIQIAISIGFSIFTLAVIGSPPLSLILDITGGVIWIIYMYRSSRIRNTYIYTFEYPDMDTTPRL